jgi:hypothetical protein
MTAGQITTGPIELRYTLTPDDLLDGVTAQRHGVRRRWPVVLMVVAALVGIAIGFVRAEAWDVSADTAKIMVVVTLILLVGGVGFGLLVYRLLLRWVYRWQVRLLLRGNPSLSQPIRTTLTDSGIHASNATEETRSSWGQYPLYTETERSFVLLASKGLGAMLLVLPKRGLGGADPARLRALLDTHSQRST